MKLKVLERQKQEEEKTVFLGLEEKNGSVWLRAYDSAGRVLLGGTLAIISKDGISLCPGLASELDFKRGRHGQIAVLE